MMSRMRTFVLSGGLAVLVALAATPAAAAVISKTYVGTLSNPLTTHGSNPANNPGAVARGNKYVIKASFDPNHLVPVDATTRLLQTRDFFSVALADAPDGTDTFELFIPAEGFGEVLTQTGLDHFPLAGSAPTAEMHFFNGCSSDAECAAEFRGFEFESNFVRSNSPTTPDPTGDIIFELRDPDAAFADATVTNHAVHVLDGNSPSLEGILLNGGHIDVRSESASAAGGQLSPGVFLAEAVPVIAEAGTTPLFYDADTLVVTTDAGTELLTDPVVPPLAGTLRAGPSAIDQQPRQADNDLGAARSDKEDYLEYVWNIDGVLKAGNLDGSRISRLVETFTVADPATEQHGSRFVNDGTRTVANINVAVGITQSGLARTIDTTAWEVTVSEDITGLADVDSVDVFYLNAPPALASQLAVEEADLSFTFDSVFTDPDLVVNGLIPGFEVLPANEISTNPGFGAGFLTGFGTTLNGNVDRLTLEGILGADSLGGTFTLFANVLDQAGAVGSTGFNIVLSPIVTAGDLDCDGDVDFDDIDDFVAVLNSPQTEEIQGVSEPATGVLLVLTLIALPTCRRRKGCAQQ